MRGVGFIFGIFRGIFMHLLESRQRRTGKERRQTGGITRSSPTSTRNVVVHGQHLKPREHLSAQSGVRFRSRFIYIFSSALVSSLLHSLYNNRNYFPL